MAGFFFSQATNMSKPFYGSLPSLLKLGDPSHMMSSGTLVVISCEGPAVVSHIQSGGEWI